VGDNTYSNRQKTAQNSNDHEEHGDDQSPLQKSTTMLAKYLVFIGCMSATFMFVILELYMVREIHELQEKIFTGRTLRKVLSDFIDAFLIIVLSIPEGTIKLKS
jgi:Ca2+ transporting ATPase